MEDHHGRADPVREDACAYIAGSASNLPVFADNQPGENTASALIDSIAADLMRIAAALGVDLGDRSIYVQQLLACRGGSNSAGTNARKALAHWRLKYNELEADRLSIEAALADETEAVRPLLVKLADQLLKVELLALDHERAVAAEARYARKREADGNTGLYEAARHVVDRLHEDHGIAEGHWYAITEEGLPALRDVIERETARRGLGSPLQPAIRNKRRAKRSR